MNFCKVYNKIINWLEYIELKYIEEHSEEYIKRNKRETKKSINILLGMLYILICILLIIISAIIVFTLRILILLFEKIDNIFTSKCDIENGETKI